MSEKPLSQQPSTASVTEIEQPLSPVRAFVVQFRLNAGGEQQPFNGRVEHITSGQAMRFHSPEELVTFFAQVLDDEKTKGHQG